MFFCKYCCSVNLVVLVSFFFFIFAYSKVKVITITNSLNINVGIKLFDSSIVLLVKLKHIVL